MKKKKLINCLSKKFIIKGAATILVVLLPFSFIKPKKADAIVGVDDAILIATLGTLAVGGTLACYGISKSGLIQKTASVIGDGLQEIGNGFKTIEDGKAIAKSLISILPKTLEAYNSEVANTSSLEKIETNGRVYNLPFTLSKTPHVICKLEFINSSQNFRILRPDLSYTGISASTCSGFGIHSIISVPWNETYGDICFSDTLIKDSKFTFLTATLAYGNYYLEIPSNASIYSDFLAPSLNDVQNKPTSISLDKAKAEAMALEYCEKYPEDNNGDKKINYSNLIPFIFDMLSKELGDGTITPQNLSNNGMVSYVYEDGQIQGMYPYDFGEQGSGNVEVNNNININNGNEVTEEEKNGILNILDNGVRKTTTLLNNLKNSMTNLGNTLQGLFDLLPEPVSYLFYSALCLSLIFFILGLRR